MGGTWLAIKPSHPELKPKYFIAAFFVILCAELFAVQFNNQALQFVFKPLLVPSIAGYFFLSLRGSKDNLKQWILLALLLSWIGDILLLFEGIQSNFFLFGLASFLIAHLFYIIFFHRLRAREQVKGRVGLMVFVVAYYVTLIVLLSPYLGDMKLPVRIYGIVISFMLMLALHAIYIKNKKAGQWMVTGAILFVLSDSALAINKFYYSFQGAGVIIILTYGLAQLFIAVGAKLFILNTKR